MIKQYVFHVRRTNGCTGDEKPPPKKFPLISKPLNIVSEAAWCRLTISAIVLVAEGANASVSVLVYLDTDGKADGKTGEGERSKLTR